MKERSNGGLDFQALERTGGINLTIEQRKGLLGAVALLRREAMEPLRDMSSKEKARKLSTGSTAGKRFLKFLDFVFKLASREYGRADLLGEEETREKILSSAMVIRKLQRQLSILLSMLDELQHDWRGEPGPKRGYFRASVSLADRICREAGGTGPYYDDIRMQYRGTVLDFCEELLKQASYPFASRDALAKAILKIR